MNEWLKFEKNGSIGTLKLNRPDIRNPLGEPEDAENFEEARDLINNDRDIRCVILTGEGSAFSAGGNVKTNSAFLWTENKDAAITYIVRNVCKQIDNQLT